MIRSVIARRCGWSRTESYRSSAVHPARCSGQSLFKALRRGSSGGFVRLRLPLEPNRPALNGSCSPSSHFPTPPTDFPSSTSSPLTHTTRRSSTAHSHPPTTEPTHFSAMAPVYNATAPGTTEKVSFLLNWRKLLSSILLAVTSALRERRADAWPPPSLLFSALPSRCQTLRPTTLPSSSLRARASSRMRVFRWPSWR